MASLLERMNVSTGPIRSKNGQSSRSSTPYVRNRTNKTPKGDSDSAWSHDMFESHNSLSARLNVQPSAPKASFNTIAQKALRDASALPSSGGFSIKGAGAAAQGNVIEVTGLVAGTTADDVAAIFQRCGAISNAKSMGGNEVRIRVTFKSPASAATAVQKFHNQAADGKTLSVRIVGSSSAGTATLAGRLGGSDGLGLVRQEGSVDVLMESEADNGSKMRSDSLLKSDRAQILVAPPGADPKEYTQNRGSDGRRGRGNNRGRKGRRGGAARMDVD
ncbi:hypothetical protein C8J56DRAFT_776832 [Mycena floridula]|nr:hypothetical protein C8J56DRAFT_776832 [Mycena floridula]